MIVVSLKEFFRTGLFGPIELGMTRNEIISLLGTPDIWGPSNARSFETATIWKYCDVEFYFTREHRLFQIFCDNIEISEDCEKMRIDYWVIHNQMAAETLKLALNQENIDYSIREVPALPGVIEIVTQELVRVCCRIEREPDDEFEELGLYSFCLSDYSLHP